MEWYSVSSLEDSWVAEYLWLLKDSAPWHELVRLSLLSGHFGSLFIQFSLEKSPTFMNKFFASVRVFHNVISF